MVTLEFPAALRLEKAKDDPSMVSVFYGPVLLAGELGHENMPDDFADKDARLKLPAVKVINEKGEMTHEAGPDFEGMDRFECREALVDRLEELGLLEKVEEHTHSVGHCSRCKTVIEPFLSRQWFVSMKPLAEPAIAAVLIPGLVMAFVCACLVAGLIAFLVPVVRENVPQLQQSLPQY